MSCLRLYPAHLILEVPQRFAVSLLMRNEACLSFLRYYSCWFSSSTITVVFLDQVRLSVSRGFLVGNFIAEKTSINSIDKWGLTRYPKHSTTMGVRMIIIQEGHHWFLCSWDYYEVCGDNGLLNEMLKDVGTLSTHPGMLSGPAAVCGLTLDGIFWENSTESDPDRLVRWYTAAGCTLGCSVGCIATWKKTVQFVWKRGISVSWPLPVLVAHQRLDTLPHSSGFSCFIDVSLSLNFLCIHCLESSIQCCLGVSRAL